MTAATATQFQPVVILHLTDLHFGWEPDDGRDASASDLRTNCLRSLLAALENLIRDQPGWKPDVVAISGDLGWQGQSKDYKAARKWLDKLKDAVELPYDKFLVCPGNHDIDRAAVERVTVPRNASEADSLLRVPVHADDLRGFVNFTKFCKARKFAPWKFSNSTNYLVGETMLVGLRFVALNSAWYCRGNQDRGNLWVGRMHLEHLIAKHSLCDASEATQPVVGMVHHPPKWWNDAETTSWPGRPSVEDSLAGRCHLLLTGHTHGDLREPDRIRRRAWHLTGGAAYADASHLNSVTLIRVEADHFSRLALRFDPQSADHQWERRAVTGPFLFREPQQSTAGAAEMAAPPLHRSIELYLQRLTEATRTIELLGMGRSATFDLPISDVYVPLTMVYSQRSDGDEPPEKGPRTKLADEFQSPAAEPDSDLLAWVLRQCQQQQKRGLVVLGEPGAGKTTWARQLAWRLASGNTHPQTLGLPPNIRPVLLKLRHLNPATITTSIDPLVSLRKFLSEATRSAAAPAGLEDPADHLWADTRSGILWILDGLDEVVDPQLRATVSSWIRESLKQRTSDWFVVTSRFQGYFSDNVLLGAGFLEFHVQGLTNQQVRQFINLWFQAAHRRVHGTTTMAAERAEADRRSLAEVLDTAPYQSPSMREMVTNPLLLTILCVVYHEEHSLPTKRAELYQHCVRVLLGLWRKEVFETQLNKPSAQPLNIEAAQAVLGRLAWWMHQQEQRTTAPLTELEKQATEGLRLVASSAELGSDGQQFIKRMREESGILAMGGEGRGHVGFLHLSFQEFLAAHHASRAGLAKELAEKAGSSWWREATLLSLRQSAQFCNDFFSCLLRSGAVQTQWDLMHRCLQEALDFPKAAFLERLQDHSVSPELRVAELRLLREQSAKLPELEQYCRSLLQKSPAASAELRDAAIEILTRFGHVIPSDLPTANTVRFHERSGQSLVWIPPGSFRMGSTRGDGDERPVHTVELTKGFSIGMYPVTNEQYSRFLTQAKYSVTPEYWNNSRFNQPTQPVVGVSWHDAVAYCKWAGGRLPTEAEWEYACRAGSASEYCFGNDEQLLAEYAWYSANSNRQTQPVGGKRPNDWGLYDMHGNVWEWCADWYDSGYYKTSPALDPLGPSSGSSRVLRGGSWGSEPVFVRCAFRGSVTPVRRSYGSGFRLVLE